ncbi:acyl carrier protein phosphodiesterase [Capnocytophaga cynodegmi]|uniref:acyl carrier protein phosphodiesterase n=1 Tax=Capnocytophaga cynodegmi TaxID=28189 RepID=UPI00385DBEEE
MNFLAHIYLSGNDDLLKIGNFIADTIRGKQYLDYPEMMQKGILLHRRIDTFTDEHLIFRRSKKRLIAEFGHYSGVIVDIFYDYFLAKNWQKYSEEPLNEYVQDFYMLLQQHKHLLNECANYLIFYMIKENWLESYQTLEGIEKIFYQMDRRTDFRSKMRLAPQFLQNNETDFEQDFFQFFSDISKEINVLLTDK